MSNIKIFDAELNLMNRIWDQPGIKAIDLANWATETLGWKKNSTYSILKKLLDKGAVSRTDPGFVLQPLVSRDEIAMDETNDLIDKMYGGHLSMFLSAFTGSQKLSRKDKAALQAMLDHMPHDE